MRCPKLVLGAMLIAACTDLPSTGPSVTHVSRAAHLGSSFFTAWSPTLTYRDDPIQLLTTRLYWQGSVSPAEHRHSWSMRWDQDGPTAEIGGTTNNLLVYAGANQGKLYIVGDEPDFKVSPATYAQHFLDFVNAVRSVDATAQFAFAGTVLGY